jgi:hypothetical protein
MNSNQRKDITLGMPHGTANGRLRKNILFYLLKKYNENVCFKCSEKIEDVDDLSIEHKKPWEGISADLFWDLQNVAFSHLHCNRPDRPSGRGITMRKIGPQGTSWCIGHQVFEPIENFWKDKAQWNGLQQYCKSTKIKSATGGMADTSDLNPDAKA